ncbi:AlbA family DNA-binding domain-containing protein [Leptospira neocaledonica]|uniref:Schlafen AlbA-2 domain-containing protein n=1 Tax=Leptospira neocaledonica TaxID=2023192 RepID=A0A2M9ZW91_9LEPT|nr:RNA-binding domain-containing protein [Leptospira neocaledonica]PJZ76295.1 hypothetical protein CH365_12940 [Leptospira neocaledonica]
MDKHLLSNIVKNPKESLSFEIKDWIDPDSDDGKAKIVRTILSLYNFNGGYLLIGFNNKTGRPNIDAVPPEVRILFNIDKIQGLIRKYSSESFEIEIEYPEVENKEFVLIIVPGGVQTPTATKAVLNENSKNSIKLNKVFIRSLESNNTPSTTEATWKDWGSIVEKCFDNREADIERFIRRHLSGIDGNKILDSLKESTWSSTRGTNSVYTFVESLLNNSAERFNLEVAERNLELPKHGSFEVAATINGEKKRYTVNQDFLNRILSANGRYSGWPFWVDSRSYIKEDNPYVLNNFWESLIIANSSLAHIEFWRISPEGEFYHRRALEDDMGNFPQSPEPFSALDFFIAIHRISECLLVLLDFASAFETQRDGLIEVMFRWSGIKNRMLSSWANPSRILFQNGISRQDEVISFIELPVDTAKTAITGFVYTVANKLFETFNGTSTSLQIIEEIVKEILSRKKNSSF